jgi:hypothetical protein
MKDGRRKFLKAIGNSATSTVASAGPRRRYRARKRPAIPSTRLYRTSATNNPLKKPMILNVPPLPGAPSCESALADKVMRNQNTPPVT